MKREQSTATCYGLIFGFRGAEVHYLNEVLHIDLIRDKDLASAAGDCVDKRRKTNDENRVQGGSGALCIKHLQRFDTNIRKKTGLRIPKGPF